MFIQTFPAFADEGRFVVQSTHNTTALFIVSFLALASNILVFIYMISKVAKTKRNPYKGELYTDLSVYKMMRSQAD
jgi:NADH:ubiquinone oxidoreductase subunit H